MSLIYKFFAKNTLIRYDKDPAIPYYDVKDFKGLNKEELIFKNHLGNNIHYYYYFYPNYKKDKILLFLTGIGPGHTAHFREINYFAKAGFKVLTLDYLGTGNSEGNALFSLNEPTQDVVELLNHLNLKEEIYVFGHSLGGYTAINILKIRAEIKKGIVMSGFLNIKGLIKTYIKFPFVANIINYHENKKFHNIVTPSNIKFLKSTTKDILFIHSIDDSKVSYRYNFLKIKSLNNTHLNLISVNHKNHNPNYTEESVIYKDKIIDTYNLKLTKGELATLEERKEYFKDVKLDDLTRQDENIMQSFIDFLEK